MVQEIIGRLLSETAAESTSTTTETTHHTDHRLGNYIVLYIMLALLAGQILKHIANSFKIPYTPMLALFGISVGFATNYLDHWGTGSEAISGIDPHLFLLIFLPPLIFESAFSIDWHIIKAEILQILILAGPWLVVNAFATAYAMKYILGYDGEFTFEAAVMFGSLISATDPVAVVSLLKDLGASRTLSTLIEGESLINDGTAFVMFTLCIDLVKGESFDFLDSSILFVRLSLGGPLLGVIMGVIVTFWLTRIVNNSILETNLTVVAAYLTFYFAETWGLEVSGILALVGLGLYMTKEGRTKISHLSEETLHQIWTFLGFAWETGVFVIAGTIISHKVFQADHSIGWEDWVKLVGLYIILHVIRFALVFILKWPLSKIGYGLTWSQAVVLGYSGLRGAVSLILAVIVYLDTDINEHIRDIVLFQTAGIALMTLFINGATMKFLVTKLGMMRMTNVKKKMLKNIIKAYRKEVGETIDELKARKNFGKIDWEALKLLASSEKIRDTIFKQRAIEREENDMVATAQLDNQNIMIDNAEYSPEELYIEAKHRYLTTLKGIYWDFFSNGQWSSRSCLLLIESADRGIDHIEDTLKDFIFIRTYFEGGCWMKILKKMKRVCLIKYVVKNFLYSNLSFVYDVTVNYVEAHEECLKLICDIIHNDEIVDKLQKEIHGTVKFAENKLYDLEEHFPEVIKAVQHKRGGFYLLNKMRNFVNELIEHGQMDIKEAKLFLHWINKENKNLELNKLKIDFEDADLDFRQNWELVKILSEAEVEHLCSYFTEHTFDANDVIIRRGEPIKYLYYISKGIVHEKNGVLDDLDAPKIKNRPGDILGLQFVAKEGGRSFTNCYAKTVCTCRTFPVSVLINLLHGDIEKEQKIWNYIGPSIIHLNPNTFTRLQELDPLQIKILQKNSEYLAFEAGSLVPLDNGGILYEGVLEEKGDASISEEDSLISESERGFGNKRKVRIKSYAFIYPTTAHYVSKSPVRIYSFPEALKASWLSFNPQVLADAFSILPGVQASHHMNTIRQSQDSVMRKQKTILLGIAKDLAHQDPLQTLRNRTGRMRRANIESKGIDFKLVDGANGEQTIMPKGYTRNLASSIKINNNQRLALRPALINEEGSESDEESKGERSTKEGLDRVRTRDIQLNIKKPGESIESSSSETPDLNINDNSSSQNEFSEQSDEASNRL